MIAQTDYYKKYLDSRTGILLSRYRKEMAATHPEFGILLDELRGLMERGGKRLRPYLAYVSYAGYGGSDISQAVDIGVALELTHLFLLIHDDIIDQDTVRYGGPNLTGVYKERLGKRLSSLLARQAAEGAALLGGDVSFMLAQRTVQESGLNASLETEVLRLLNRMTLDVAAGELLDLILPLESDGSLTFEQVEAIYVSKTAGYSVVVPLQLGNLLAGGSETERQALARFGTPLGVAYQIQDDILGMFGDEAKLGKSNLSDMRQGKHTPLYVHAMEHASAAQINVLHNAYGSAEAGTAELAAVRGVMVESGALERTQDMMRDYAGQARAALASLSLSHEARDALSSTLEQSINRTY